MLTVSDLLVKGYFHDRVIPPLRTDSLSSAVPELEDYVKHFRKNLRSRCVHHSVPKRKHLRRLLSIPNPFHQTLLTRDIARYWNELEQFVNQSQISLSIPEVSSKRSLATKYEIGAVTIQRALRSVGSRYLLRTDLARFYPSIYTHSIGWAIHGKQNARTNKKLYGNILDKRMRDTQDQQTGGIPIGPDTSFLIAEVIGTALDLELQASVPNLKGVRFIDDYYLYFDSLPEAERALAQLHKIAKGFELEVNDPKTEIVALPDELEPAWKTELRAMEIRPFGQPQSTDLVSLFNRGFDLALKYPSDNVLTYVAKQVASTTLDPVNWPICEALLLKAALAEPTMMSVLLEILEQSAPFISSTDQIQRMIVSLCAYHAPLQQGYEVAWALWLARHLYLALPDSIATAIADIDDDIVALVALDLLSAGLLNFADVSRWQDLMVKDNLYTEHWLLAYEAHEQGWLQSRDGNDYIAGDGLFDILRKHHVRFYDPIDAVMPASATGYEDEDTDEQTDETPESVSEDPGDEDLLKLLLPSAEVEEPPTDS